MEEYTPSRGDKFRGFIQSPAAKIGALLLFGGACIYGTHLYKESKFENERKGIYSEAAKMADETSQAMDYLNSAHHRALDIKKRTKVKPAPKKESLAEKVSE